MFMAQLCLPPFCLIARGNHQTGDSNVVELVLLHFVRTTHTLLVDIEGYECNVCEVKVCTVLVCRIVMMMCKD